MKHIHFNFISDFTAFEIDANDDEFEIIADYLYDAGLLSNKRKMVLIDRFKKSSNPSGTWLGNEKHQIFITIFPCEKDKNVTPKKEEGNAKLFRIIAGDSFFMDNPDMSNTDMSYDKAMKIIRACLSAFSDSTTEAIKAIDQLYKLTSGFQLGSEVQFDYRESTFLHIKRVA